MNRDIYQSLIAWKKSSHRKPLILLGARQTGKTFLLKAFGSKEYGRLIYANFEEDPYLHQIFAKGLSPQKVLKALELNFGITINAETDLLFFDEIQASNNALNALKYFCEEAPEYHIVSAGSLLGVKITAPHSFPVGKVTFRHLYPLTFAEFLDGINRHDLRSMLDGLQEWTAIPTLAHNLLIDLLKTYYVVGGMPEAVRIYAETGSFESARSVHDDILKAYERDFAKHAPTSDIPKLSLLWDLIPTQLARENRKFMFSAIAGSARAREYENALRWLADAGLVILAHAVSTVQQPLAGFIDRSVFKVYALDTGLLATKAGIPAATLLNGNELFSTYHGMLVENYAAQQFTANQTTKGALCYWRTDSQGAEVDFLLDITAHVYPVEVKAGINPRSKSLKSFDQRFSPPILLRTSLLNFIKQERIINVPLYAIHLMAKVAEQR